MLAALTGAAGFRAADRAERLARSTGAEIAGTAEELIEGVDAVYITTPNTKHTALALAGIAEVAALADDDEFARRHLSLFRRLAQRHPRIGSSAATARIRGLRDSSGGAGCR